MWLTWDLIHKELPWILSLILKDSLYYYTNLRTNINYCETGPTCVTGVYCIKVIRVVEEKGNARDQQTLFIHLNRYFLTSVVGDSMDENNNRLQNVP